MRSLPDRRRVVALEERQLREQAAERAAHAEVGFARRVDRADHQAFAVHADLQRQRRRCRRASCDAAAVERAQAVAGVGIERERAVERGLERAPGDAWRQLKASVGGSRRSCRRF